MSAGLLGQNNELRPLIAVTGRVPLLLARTPIAGFLFVVFFDVVACEDFPG
jgi:hypothetical protein